MRGVAARSSSPQPMDARQIGQIHLEHLNRAGAGAAFHVLARFGMAAAAGHQHAAAARRQIDGDGLSEPAVGAGHQADLAVDAPALGHWLDGRPFRGPLADGCAKGAGDALHGDDSLGMR